MMNSAGITALRQDAYSLLEEMPEEKLVTLVQFMRNMKDDSTRKPDLQERRAAFERLEQLCRPIPDLDEEKELAEWREEKFGNAGAD